MNDEEKEKLNECVSAEERFVRLVEGIGSARSGCDIDGLLARLKANGFFEAPASSQYNCAYVGGLVEHSLNVYTVMKCLVDRFGDGFDAEEAYGGMMDKVGKYQSDLIDEVNNTSYNDVFSHAMSMLQSNDDEVLQAMMNVYGICQPSDADAYRIACERFVKEMSLPQAHRYDDVSVRIVALLHAVDKANLYEESVRNEKVYGENGGKRDELGKFDWVSKRCYKTVDSSKRDSIGGNGFSSYYEVSEFIPLTKEETTAIVNQYQYYGRCDMNDLPAIMSKHNLTAFLHAAEIIATYCLDRRNG